MPTGADRLAPAPGSWDLEAAAPAKLNLGLEIVGKRADGYHDIRTVFQAIDLEDRLLVRGRGKPGILLRIEGREGLPTDASNLVVRAGESFSRRWAPGRGAEILLRKRIPWGAGLGGGSSDAAAALLALDRLWEVAADPADLAALALEIGSDVPFFLLGGTARGEGRGEILRPCPAPPECLWVLFLPPYRISTEDAYRLTDKDLTIDSGGSTLLEHALIRGDYEGIVKNLSNDLEAGAFRLQPRLRDLAGAVRDLGPDAVLMTGSGSALFALTTRGETAERLLNPEAIRARSVQSRGAWLDVERVSIRPVRTGARLLPQTA